MIYLYCAAGLIGLFILLFFISIWTWRLKWAMLIKIHTLPLTLQKNHDDWWPWLRWIPRRLTAYVFGRGNPVQLLGTNPKNSNQDVPLPGTWCLSWPLHFALLTKKGTLFGFGVRRDYYENYWTFPRAVWRKN